MRALLLALLGALLSGTAHCAWPACANLPSTCVDVPLPPVYQEPALKMCQQTRFVHTDGNDTASGTSPALAWRTLAKVNEESIRPGTCIFLRGGDNFTGVLNFEADDAGDARNPVVLGSYGNGRATISPPAGGTGVFVYNTSGITIQDINFHGPTDISQTPTAVQGICVTNNLPNAKKLQGITIQRVRASWFSQYGIIIGSGPDDGSKSGFADVVIRDSCVSNNLRGGVATYSVYDAAATTYAHSNFHLARIHSYNNPGSMAVTNSNTGNGIFLSDVDTGSILECTAYGNGCNNGYSTGGPIGIWAYDSTRVEIRHCESFSNRSGSKRVDGGGFGFDVGTTNSTMMDNYSHDNDGPGYLIFQTGDGRPNRGNVIINNKSINDARVGMYSGILLGSVGTPVVDAFVADNVVSMTPSSSGSPAAIRISQRTQNANIVRNKFETSGGVSLVSVEKNTTSKFCGNEYDTHGDAVVVLVGGGFLDDSTAKKYSSLAAWKTATGAENETSCIK